MSLRRVCLALSVSIIVSAVSVTDAHAASVPQIAVVADGQLFVVGADGKGRREISARNPIDISHASWAANGRVLYTTRSGRFSGSSEWPREKWELRKVDSRTSKDKQVTSLDLCCQRLAPVEAAGQWIDPPPVWSPNGKRAAFTLWTCVNSFVWGLGCLWESQIFVVNADGSGLAALAGTVDGSDPAWSPDGKRLAFTRIGTVEVVDSSNGLPIAKINPADTLAHSPRWSPDGRKIAFVGAQAAELLGAGRIWVAKADGTSARALPAHTYDPPSWSPDSRSLAYSEATSSKWRNGIFKIRADGRYRKRLTGVPAANVDVGAPQWSPDGSRIALIRNQWEEAPRLEPKTSIWTVDPKKPLRPRQVARFWDHFPTFAWRAR